MKKLIRDKLDHVLPENELSIVEGDDYDFLLQQKLHEEIHELEDSNFSDAEEYADVIQVLIAIGETQGISFEHMLSKRIEKLYERGGFSKGLVLTR